MSKKLQNLTHLENPSSYLKHVDTRMAEPDVLIAAACLMELCNEGRVCGCCLETDTPQWRKGYIAYINDDQSISCHLCNACGLKYKNGNYCSYCLQTYSAGGRNKDSEIWTCCNECRHYDHIKCQYKYSHSNNLCLRCLKKRKIPAR
jgi:hypothetical protein